MNEPTDSDHQHIAHIRREFDDMMEQKYIGGILEHGGLQVYPGGTGASD